GPSPNRPLQPRAKTILLGNVVRSPRAPALGPRPLVPREDPVGPARPAIRRHPAPRGLGAGHHRPLHHPRLHGNRRSTRRLHLHHPRRSLAGLGAHASPALVRTDHGPMKALPSVDTWDRRIERAQILERDHPPAAELLRFYRLIAAFQKRVAQSPLPVGPFSLNPAQLPEPLHSHVGPLLSLLQRNAPPPLAQAAQILSYTYDWDPADPAPRFVTRVLIQPYAESLARRADAAPCSPGPVC